MNYWNRYPWIKNFVLFLLLTSGGACSPVSIGQTPTPLFLDTNDSVTLIKTPQQSITSTDTTQPEPTADQTPTTTENQKELTSKEPTSVSLAKATETSSPKPTTPVSTPGPWPQDNAALLSNDLLFIAQGSLMRWNSLSQEVETWIVSEDILELPASSNGSTNYPGKILSYAADVKVEKIALLRSEGITANGVELFDIDLFDVETREAWTVVDNSTRISHMSISPDGKWVAYQIEEDNVRINFVPTSEETDPVEISISGDGSRIADDFEWSPDSRYLAWIDSGGIWLSDSGGFQPRLAISDTISMIYFGGEQSQIRVEFESLNWSPQGRYLLTRVSPWGSEVSWMGIVDTDRGLVAEVPGSFRSGELIHNAEWMSDGDILIVNRVNQDEDSTPSLSIWQLMPTHAELIMPKLNIILVDSPSSPSTNSPLQAHDLAFPRKLTYRQYAFITVPVDPSDEPQIFVYDTINHELEAVCELPTGTMDVSWSGDGGGAILVGRHGSAIMATFDGGAFDLYQITGMDACCFSWFPQE